MTNDEVRMTKEPSMLQLCLPWRAGFTHKLRRWTQGVPEQSPEGTNVNSPGWHRVGRHPG